MEWMAPAKRQIQSLGEYGAIPDAIAKLARCLADRYVKAHRYHLMKDIGRLLQ